MENKEKCPKCSGTGVLTKICRRCNGAKFYQGNLCTLCHGTGTYVFMKNARRKEEIPCQACKGHGTILKFRPKNPLINARDGYHFKKMINNHQ